MKAIRKRLDYYLVEEGYVENVNEALSLILARKVQINETVVTKAGTLFKPHKDVIKVRLKAHPYVSRGGLKLEHAMEHFGLNCENQIAVDVGASTGGFTDVLLQRDASKVYALDVGREQLHFKLQQDPRVVNWEGRNIRHWTANWFEKSIWPTIGVMDVSFVSVTQTLPHLANLIEAGGSAENSSERWIMALLKPQFEFETVLGKHPEFNGVVSEASQRSKILEATLDSLKIALQPGWQLTGTLESPIKGAKGNVEFLSLWTRI
jgi:23S rRNA (cytidine1920-2'-O)/16S rRNA (cytidine1409-2'-O)-methyltransferase